MWVRTQNKENLIETKRILFNVSPSKKFQIINQVSYIDETDDYDVLGEYKTKERCIEIIDSMQQYLENLKNNEIPFSVYGMPEE